MRLAWIIAGALSALTGCATPEPAPPEPAALKAPASPRPAPEKQPRHLLEKKQPVRLPLSGLALIERLLPASLPERGAWAKDIHDAMAALGIEPSAQNACAVLAITEQESGFRADPPVPGLAEIARGEIERRRSRAGIPRFLVQAALALPSSDGRRYGERLEAARTEGELSELFEDLAARVPMAKLLLAGRNPVRTGGPMQVGIEFARAHAAAHPYPYARSGSLREEVFTRRGGLYFGIAHLLHYRAPYDDPIYRFADFNAGRFASRNAAFQKALSEASGVALELDGDLLRYEDGHALKAPSLTELATRRLAARLRMSHAEIRRDLELGTRPGFEASPLYAAVFSLAERELGSRAPRAVLPEIVLDTAKTARKLTSASLARRAAERYRACLKRA